VAIGPKVNRRRYDREIVNRVVAAVDSNFAGMVEQQSGERDFNKYAVVRAALWLPRDDGAFEKLKYRDGRERQLLVDLRNGRKKRKTQNEEEPDNIDPAHKRLFAVKHRAGSLPIPQANREMNLA
jgi:hypothetical protein